MKRRILQHFILVIAVSSVMTAVLMAILAYGMFEQRVMADLRVDAKVLSAMMESDTDEHNMDGLAGELRLTLIGPDGAVEYDNMANRHGMDSHADRPEVRQALASGEGADIRNSKTVEKSAFYYALRLEDGSILRVAKEASSIWSIYMRAIPLILLVLTLMVGLAAIAANLLTGRLLEPIKRMTQSYAEDEGDTQYPELQPVLHMMRAQREEIMRSANMRVEFTANVSHELKTPLTSISGYAELIENGMAEGQQARRFAGEIHKSASRLLNLINDIIRLSQMDEARHETEMESVNLAQTAQNVIEQLRISAQKAEVTLTLEAQTAMIKADGRMMEELIFNLLDNAIRYNVRGGSVRAKVYPVKEHVLLIVQDTGIGIGKENQERIFERFYRVDKSRSKATGGTGLGLAIVKHIAARHHAVIDVKSELGRGTQITVTFSREGWTKEGNNDCI